MSRPRSYSKAGKHPQFAAICASLAALADAPKPKRPDCFDFSRINLKATRESVIEDMAEKSERLAMSRAYDMPKS